MADCVAGAALAETQSFNANLDALEQINIGLRKARPGSTNEAGLLDERDRLLDRISAQAGVDISLDDRGAATLRVAATGDMLVGNGEVRSEEHTSELQSLMRISYAVFCLKKKKIINNLQYSTN